MAIIKTGAGPLRSWLFTPATQPQRFANAWKSGADVLIADLEDSVSPDQKPSGRENIRNMLNDSTSNGEHALAVRINSTATRAGIADLSMLLDSVHTPDFIIMPKVEDGSQVAQIASLLNEAGKHSQLVPMIESPQELSAMTSILTAAPLVGGLMFGAADYAASVRAALHSLAVQTARCTVAAACAKMGVIAIDAPCFSIRDPEQLRTELTFALDNGFTAKAAIHPSQLAAINDAFRPSEERIAWARRVLEACPDGVGVVDGQMVDEAIMREARYVLESA